MKKVKELRAQENGKWLIRVEATRDCSGYGSVDFERDFNQVVQGAFVALQQKFYPQDIKVS